MVFEVFKCLTEISEDKRIHRVKRQCGCCSCYGSGTSSCPCSSSCSCIPGANNYATGYNDMGYGSNGINVNAGYGNYGYDYLFNQGYPYTSYGQYNANGYGINYNIGNGCGLKGTASSTACGMSNIFPYNFGTSYGNNFGTGDTGYVYPQMTGCSTAFNTRCYCGTGYSPCNNGALCCKNSLI
uniref:Keratin-associated protein 21-1-like n=1 Tax=Loa loa TaxID=7209 RepID=A0A1I7V841_LOALO